MRAALAASLAIGLLAGACGDDDDTASDDTTETTETTEGGEAAGALELTLTDDGLEGVPESITAGAVEVTLTVEGSREFASLDFAHVEDGTTVEQFAEGIAPVFEGGAFPDFFLNNSGLPETEPGTPSTSKS